MLTESPRDVLRGLLLTEATEKFLKKMPPNTDIRGMLDWSLWDGKLALVYGPSYSDIHGSFSAPKTSFDPAQMARRYTVRFATDNRGKRLAPPNKSVIGHEIVVQDGRKQYWETTWSIGRPGYGPVDTGSFEKKTENYLVAVKLKDLGKAEVRTLSELYDSYGYLDVGGRPRLRLKQAAWKKVLSKKKFNDTQDLDSDLANAAYELVRMRNGFKDPRDPTDEQIIWDAIQGIYSVTNKGDKITFILRK